MSDKPKLIKVDLGSDASKTYKDNLFEDKFPQSESLRSKIVRLVMEHYHLAHHTDEIHHEVIDAVNGALVDLSNRGVTRIYLLDEVKSLREVLNRVQADLERKTGYVDKLKRKIRDIAAQAFIPEGE